jgi:hypothetical protein
VKIQYKNPSKQLLKTKMIDNRDDEPTTCCDWVVLLIYGFFLFVINICPVIGQLCAIYRLIRHEKYLGNPNQTIRSNAHFWLIINGYVVGYLVCWLLYHIIKFLFNNIHNEDEPFKRHLAQTIVGLVVFKLWYELLHYGVKWVYDYDFRRDERVDSDICAGFCGYIFLTIATGGIFVPFRILQLIINNWHSDNPFKRHIAQTIGGLIVLKLWYELLHYGIKWVYNYDFRTSEYVEDNGVCLAFFGYVFLIVATLGIFVPFRIVQLVINNWFSDNAYKKHLAQTIGGLIIFKVWYELAHYGIKWVYNDDTHICLAFLGYIFLIVATLGIFVPFRVIQLIINNWHSDNALKRHLAQTIGGLIIFKVWYELFYYGIKWVYGIVGFDLTFAKRYDSSLFECFVGYVFLIFATGGVFILFRIVQLIVLNFYSENDIKRHIAQTLGGFVIGKIWYELVHYGIKWVYNYDISTKTVVDTTKCDVFWGHVFLSIATFGIFIPLRIVQLIITNWYSENPLKRHLVQTLGGLIIFKIWYELIHYGIKWVYNYDFQTDTNVNNQTFCRVFWGYIFLIIATFGIFIPFRITQLIILNWKVEDPFKRHFAQTLGGLIIFKVWYEFVHYGIKWVYDYDFETKVQIQNANNPNNPNDQMPQDKNYNTFANNQINLPPIIHEPNDFHAELPNNHKCKNILKYLCGLLFLTIATGGIFIIYRVIELVILNWHSPDQVKRHLAQTIGGLIVFKLWYELVHYGVKWVYDYDFQTDIIVDPQVNKCYGFIGHLFLTISTFGIFVPFRIVQLICNNWQSDDPVKKHIAQTLGGLIVFKLWYELVHYGVKWVYDYDFQTDTIINPTVNNYYGFVGYVFLTISTFGIFIPFRIVQLICNNWHSYNPVKKHIAQTLGGLIVFKLWYELAHYGIKWVYIDPPINKCYGFVGHVFLTISTLGIFIPFRIVQLVCGNWHSDNPVKKHIAQTLGGLIVFKLWYELVHYGIKWVYDFDFENGKNANVDLEPVAVIPIQEPPIIIEHAVVQNDDEPGQQNDVVIVIDNNNDNNNNDNNIAIPPHKSICEHATKHLFGLLFLTIATIGIFIPFRIVQLIILNWNSKNPIEKQIAQLIGGLIIFKIAYESYKLAYCNRETTSAQLQVLGRFGLLFVTCGIYTLYLICEYIYRMIHNLRSAPYTQKYYIGIIQASTLTFGLVGLLHGSHVINKKARDICKILLVVWNYVVYYIIYQWILVEFLPLPIEKIKYFLILLCCVNYVTYTFAQYLGYNETIRYLADSLSQGRIIRWWKFKHIFDKVGYKLAIFGIGCGNSASRARAHVRTKWSAFTANFSNKTWQKWQSLPIIVPGNPDYIAPVVFNPTITPRPVIKTWNEKWVERTQSPNALNKKKLANTIYCLECIINKLEAEFANKINTVATCKADFLAKRYDKLDNTMIVYADYTASPQFTGIFYIANYHDRAIFPVEGMPTKVYRDVKQYFQEYINELRNLQKDIYSKRYNRLDQYLVFNAV